MVKYSDRLGFQVSSQKFRFFDNVRKVILLVFLLVCWIQSHVEAKSFVPSELFAREFIALSNPVSGVINSTLVDANGQVYLFGSRPGNTSAGFFIIKLSDNSSEIWRREIVDFPDFGTPASIDMDIDSPPTSLYLLLKGDNESEPLETALNFVKIDAHIGDQVWQYSYKIETIPEQSKPKIAIRKETEGMAIYVTYVVLDDGIRGDGLSSSVLAKIIEDALIGSINIVWSAMVTDANSTSHSSALALSKRDDNIYLVEITSEDEQGKEKPKLQIHRYNANNTVQAFARIPASGNAGEVKIMLGSNDALYIAEVSGYFHRLSLIQTDGKESELRRFWTVKETSISDFDMHTNESLVILVGTGPGFTIPTEGGSPVMSTSPLIAALNSSNGDQIFRELYPQSSRNVAHQMNAVSMFDNENMIAIIGGSSQLSGTNLSDPRRSQTSVASFKFDLSRSNISTTPDPSSSFDNDASAATSSSIASSQDRKLTIGITLGCISAGLLGIVGILIIIRAKKKKNAGNEQQKVEGEPEDPRSPAAKNLLV
eukprot:Plantae.Rhodophyta-Hildenbrandia_rubra.ctg14905.p1 GENE.Plantae.Rhodophyta-Hildenbrandia_rubra.ctg14905~~Plantae.Rhodophyta-Hildenbrandia_rubra.ctg14905.p1  ORF type:complete len:541 (+),score=60.57 Plantae.Rhodophyta-Hildenbrandia_rubra.ctg14905:279-1901(+)